MSKTKVVWHPFPETHPPKSGDYLITTRECRVAPEVDFGYYDREAGMFIIHDDWYILAWAEAPEPYKPTQNEHADEDKDR